MADQVVSLLPWLLSAITIWMTVLAGNKHPSAWAVGLGNQALWLVWIIASASWGLFPLMPDTDTPLWRQIETLFQRHGQPAPSTGLRDKLVTHLLWAHYAAAPTTDPIHPASGDLEAAIEIIQQFVTRIHMERRCNNLGINVAQPIMDRAEAFLAALRPATASGDLEAVRAIIDAATHAALPPVCDVTGNGTKERAAIQVDIANRILAALRLANPPATAAGVGEAHHKAIGKALYARREGNRSVEAAIKRLAASGFQITRIETTPASHDALIARVREVLEPFAKAGQLFDVGDYAHYKACIYNPAAGDDYALDSGHLLAARALLTEIAR
jgi:hypothetical protein